MTKKKSFITLAAKVSQKFNLLSDKLHKELRLRQDSSDALKL
jgi:hypothetical protein